MGVVNFPATPYISGTYAQDAATDAAARGDKAMPIIILILAAIFWELSRINDRMSGR
jgi:hypothetical protein